MLSTLTAVFVVLNSDTALHELATQWVAVVVVLCPSEHGGFGVHRQVIVVVVEVIQQVRLDGSFCAAVEITRSQHALVTFIQLHTHTHTHTHRQTSHTAAISVTAARTLDCLLSLSLFVNLRVSMLRVTCSVWPNSNYSVLLLQQIKAA